MAHKVYIRKITGDWIKPKDISNALDWLEWHEIVPKDARVFIKPNLTWPEHLPGVTTTPKAIESVVIALLERTSNIYIGESDGGYHSYKAEEAFELHGLYELEKKFGISIFNLSKDEAVTNVLEIDGKTITVTLPNILLNEIDVFITMPVPKVHVMTQVSLAFKNQWGCIPSTMRLREHYDFDRKIIAINKLIKPKLVIFDGTYFLNDAGPMSGTPVRMDTLLMGNDPGATSAVALEIMGISPNKVRHLQLAAKVGVFPQSGLDNIFLNTELDNYKTQKFVMKRALLDWISLIGFRSSFFTHLFWDSWLAGPLHKLLFYLRKNSALQQILYGDPGAPPEWRKYEKDQLS